MLDAPSLDRLRELDPDGQMGLLPRVLRTFDSSMIKLLQQLNDAQGARDPQVVRHVAHTLKSSAASVGALQLSAMCADIERRVRESDTAELPARLEAMVAECQRLRTGLKFIASA
ncbi:MAG: Hpt domain-containing protein [Aquincola sp.]|nr:Hpt domain-containing protein [Aquincola sp.]